MRVAGALALVALLALVPLVGSWFGLNLIFGVVVPYLALAIFVVGVIARVLGWASRPVPFRITTTTGQAKSLRGIKRQPLEAPATGWETFWRMAAEVVLFRSLFRNTRSELKEGRIVHGSAKWLWLAGLAFHVSLLVIVLRHLRYFVVPTPGFVELLQNVDGFFQVGLPILYLTDLVFLGAVGYLLLRRLVLPQLRYLSLVNDYFPLLLLLGIGCTGVLMRYFTKVDIVGVKELAAGLFSFAPVAPEGIGALFYIHLFLVSALIAYFPFSKLMHMAGIFLTPTRNLPNNSRVKRHVNPWNPAVEVHTYAEYEDEFRPLMKAAGLPLDRDPDAKPEPVQPAGKQQPAPVASAPEEVKHG